MRYLEFLILFSALISLASCSKDTFTPDGTKGPSNTVISKTGRIWMDRNLGASQVAKNSTDSLAFGDLYQWGRVADGHQIRTSATTSTLSSKDIPGNGLFIKVSNLINDWRSPSNNDLWQGLNGTNNPCPSGFRLPTSAEIEEERKSWISNNAAGAFASILKLPQAGYREDNGTLFNVGGSYWSSTINGPQPLFLNFFSSNAIMYSNFRAKGFSVRCIKD
jgi:uncharacterized protein (TIGR02145 family)